MNGERTSAMRRLKTVVASTLLAVILSGCSLVPTEKRPAIDVPTSYRESAGATNGTTKQDGEMGRWVPAQPADAQKPSPWWHAFGDPVLVQLEGTALLANPDVAIAMARIKQSRALTSRSESQRYPDIDAGFGPTRQRTSSAAQNRLDGEPATSQTLWRAQINVAYEADLFGRVSADVEAARASGQEQQALAHQMLLVVQADVATRYFTLRQLEGERRLLDDTVTLREAAVDLLDRQHVQGLVAPVVLDQAKTELFQARAEKLSVEQNIGLTHHALAVLLGQTPAALDLTVAPLENVAPRLAEGLPSTLLERRPDVAAAERTMAAENARIGVARAAFFPSLSLTGTLGFESSQLSNLSNWSQRTFLLGPLVGTALSLPLLDGGRKKADLALARSVYEERVAEYRKTVLGAFREVEDALVSMRTLDERITYERAAGEAASRVAQTMKLRFGEGDIDYLPVVDAERTSLRTRQSIIQAEGARVRATVNLVRALGGGWEAPRPPDAVAER